MLQIIVEPLCKSKCLDIGSVIITSLLSLMYTPVVLIVVKFFGVFFCLDKEMHYLPNFVVSFV